MSRNANPLVVALLETIATIELADERSINLDFAVSLTEQIAATLRHLTKAERES